jgi:hypothetical protein
MAPIPGLGLPELPGDGWMFRCDFPKLFRKSRREIEQWDVVELKHDAGKWPAGTRGEVLVDQRATKVVKVSDELGRPLAAIELPEEELELVAKSLRGRR